MNLLLYCYRWCVWHCCPFFRCVDEAQVISRNRQAAECIAGYIGDIVGSSSIGKRNAFYRCQWHCLQNQYPWNRCTLILLTVWFRATSFIPDTVLVFVTAELPSQLQRFPMNYYWYLQKDLHPLKTSTFNSFHIYYRGWCCPTFSVLPVMEILLPVEVQMILSLLQLCRLLRLAILHWERSPRHSESGNEG